MDTSGRIQTVGRHINSFDINQTKHPDIFDAICSSAKDAIRILLYSWNWKSDVSGSGML